MALRLIGLLLSTAPLLRIFDVDSCIVPHEELVDVISGDITSRSVINSGGIDGSVSTTDHVTPFRSLTWTKLFCRARALQYRSL